MTLLHGLRTHRKFRSAGLVAASAYAVTVAVLATRPQHAHAGIAGLERVATGYHETNNPTGLRTPMLATYAPGDPTRLFIAERGTPNSSTAASASVRILNLTTGVLEPTPFLTITGVDNRGEGGLLGLAFHPDYETNGKLYAYLTAPDSVPNTSFSSYVREYTRSGSDPNRADPTFTPILQFGQPQENHNGGWIGFGPNDGYLYLMTGDGGNGNDSGSGHTEPGGNAQDLTSNWLGKVLRVDVNRDDFADDASRNYGIPHDVVEGDVVVSPGNPFAPDAPGESDPLGDDEIWAYGLRNPYRAGFDRVTGDLWIGDVGQSSREEIDFQPGDSAGGENYGWRLREGLIETPGSVGGPKPPGAVDPVWDYRRPGSSGADPLFTGTTVTGGVPYRGPDPELQGLYFFADFGSSRVWSLRLPTDTEPVDVDYISPLLTPGPGQGSLSSPVAFGEDAVGNVYIVSIGGSVYRIKTDAVTPGDFDGNALVDAGDLAAWTANFGTATGATAADGDADGDEDVDGNDLLIWQRNYGWSPNVAASTGASAPAPEPAAAALIAIGMIAAVRGRRREQRMAARAATFG